jgi:small-conductance mechanosensitive channel
VGAVSELTDKAVAEILQRLVGGLDKLPEAALQYVQYRMVTGIMYILLSVILVVFVLWFWAKRPLLPKNNSLGFSDESDINITIFLIHLLSGMCLLVIGIVFFANIGDWLAWLWPDSMLMEYSRRWIR